MVDVPRHPEPSDAERLYTFLSRMTPGGAGGDSRAVGPVMSRTASRAVATGSGSDEDSLDGRESEIDRFTVTGTGTTTFTLDFSAIEKSWNVSCGYPLDDTVDYTIDGRTVTILNPSTTFIGASATFPKTLQVQYDYLGAVPTTPTELAALTSNIATANTTSNSSPLVATFPTAPASGGTVLVAVNQSFTDCTLSGLGATWTRLVNNAPGGDPQCSIWSGVGCNGTDTAVTVSVTANSPREVGCIEVLNVTTTGVQTATGTGTAVGPLTAPAKGGIGIAVIAQPTTLVSELPSAWTVVYSGNDSGAIALLNGEVASRTFNTSKIWAMALLASV